MQSDIQDLCPVCEQDNRSLYKLASGRIILYCNECSSVWLNLKNTGWGESVSDEKLRELLGDNMETEFDLAVKIW